MSRHLFFPEKQLNVKTKTAIFWSKERDHHKLACFLVLGSLFSLYLLNHSFYFYHSFVTACITQYLRHNSSLHNCHLNEDKLLTITVFRWSWVYTVKGNQGKKRIFWVKSRKIRTNREKNREHFSWSPEIFIFQNKSVNFVNFLNLWNLVL